MNIEKFDRIFIKDMHTWGIPALRVSLGIVFLWFGILKLVGSSPVTWLIEDVYTFFPTQIFIIVLGIWEVIIGIGLIAKMRLRFILALLWLQMLGTFSALLLSPFMFFQNGNPLLLTMEGEFIIKNFVLITASIVIGGYEVKQIHSNIHKQH